MPSSFHNCGNKGELFENVLVPIGVHGFSDHLETSVCHWSSSFTSYHKEKRTSVSVPKSSCIHDTLFSVGHWFLIGIFFELVNSEHFFCLNKKKLIRTMLHCAKHLPNFVLFFAMCSSRQVFKHFKYCAWAITKQRRRAITIFMGWRGIGSTWFAQKTTGEQYKLIFLRNSNEQKQTDVSSCNEFKWYFL